MSRRKWNEYDLEENFEEDIYNHCMSNTLATVEKIDLSDIKISEKSKKEVIDKHEKIVHTLENMIHNITASYASHLNELMYRQIPRVEDKSKIEELELKIMQFKDEVQTLKKDKESKQAEHNRLKENIAGLEKLNTKLMEENEELINQQNDILIEENADLSKKLIEIKDVIERLDKPLIMRKRKIII